MANLGWCLKAPHGLELAEPSPRLAADYLSKAEGALVMMREATLKEWKVTAAYYSLYFALYAVLMRLGVKCEIHTCTLLFMRRFLSRYFASGECALLESGMKARIDAQYYVGREIPYDVYEQLMQRPPEFLEKCRAIIARTGEKDSTEIRAAVARS